MKKVFLLVTLVFLLVACGGKKVSSEVKKFNLPESKYKVSQDNPGYETSKKDMEEISWYVNYGWYNHKWGESVVTQQMQEDTGIKVNFTAGDDQKLNALVASGSLPDVVTLDANSPLAKSPNIEKIAYPLDVLAEAYDPYFFKVADSGLLNWNKLKDGHTYGYQNFAISKEGYDTNKVGSGETFLVRKDIYEALGKPDMTTKEGFMNALKMCQEKFATEDGQKIIPFGTDTGVINVLGPTLQNFLGLPNEKDGKVYDKFNDSEYLNWLKTFRAAFKSGYIAKDNFSDTNEQIEEKVNQGRFFVYWTNGVSGKQAPLNAIMNSKPDKQYIAVDGPKNVDGSDYALQGQGINGWTITFISKKAKHPERIIQLLTYMISKKGQEVAFFGKLGKTYDIVDGRPKVKPEIMKFAAEKTADYNRTIGIGEVWQFGDSLYEMEYRNITNALVQPLSWSKGKAKPKHELINIDPESTTIEFKKLQKINTNWNETLGKMLLSKDDSEFDSLFNKFIEFRKSNDWDKISQIRDENMKNNKERLGMK